MDYRLKDLMRPAGAAKEEKMLVMNVVVSLDLEEMSVDVLSKNGRER